MGVIGGIKKWASDRAIAKVGAQRGRREVMNFHRAQKVGLLFESTSEDFFSLIKYYVAYLKEEHGIVEIKALGYVDAKEEPRYHRHDLYYDYFTKKDVNWMGRPKCDSARHFVETDFDILIDCTRGECVPLNFVGVESAAKFKVCRSQPHEDHYDMVIQVDDSVPFDTYAKQLNNFLSTINHDAA